MRNSILKSIVIGALIGAALFAMPFFLISTFLWVLVISGILRLIAFRRFHRQWAYHMCGNDGFTVVKPGYYNRQNRNSGDHQRVIPID